MFARVLTKSTGSAIIAVRRAPPKLPLRMFTQHTAPPAAVEVVDPDVVIITEKQQERSLEWILDSPPNFHEFAEPPIVVEIEHLKNLKIQGQH